MASSKEQTNAADGKKERSWPDFASWSRCLSQATEEAAASKPLPPALYIVATPIGNLGDITLRALWVLQRADRVLCEDTRVTGGLLHQFGIKKPLIACHDHNEEARIKEVLTLLAQGQSLALVSDAGTPLLSDPGFRLVRACRAAGAPVFAVPGASALLTGLCSAGLPTDAFFFHGFLPTKPTARRKALEGLKTLSATLVFYETGPRLAASLQDMAGVLGEEREAAVARELTKLYETVETGPLSRLAAEAAGQPAPKGELVILVGPPLAEEAPSLAKIEALLAAALETMSVRDAAAHVAALLGLKKSDVYQRALTINGKN